MILFNLSILSHFETFAADIKLKLYLSKQI